MATASMHLDERLSESRIDLLSDERIEALDSAAIIVILDVVDACLAKLAEEEERAGAAYQANRAVFKKDYDSSVIEARMERDHLSSELNRVVRYRVKLVQRLDSLHK